MLEDPSNEQKFSNTKDISMNAENVNLTKSARAKNTFFPPAQNQQKYFKSATVSDPFGTLTVIWNNDGHLQYSRKVLEFFIDNYSVVVFSNELADYLGLKQVSPKIIHRFSFRGKVINGWKELRAILQKTSVENLKKLLEDLPESENLKAKRPMIQTDFSEEKRLLSAQLQNHYYTNAQIAILLREVDTKVLKKLLSIQKFVALLLFSISGMDISQINYFLVHFVWHKNGMERLSFLENSLIPVMLKNYSSSTVFSDFVNAIVKSLIFDLDSKRLCFECAGAYVVYHVQDTDLSNSLKDRSPEDIVRSIISWYQKEESVSLYAFEKAVGYLLNKDPSSHTMYLELKKTASPFQIFMKQAVNYDEFIKNYAENKIEKTQLLTLLKNKNKYIIFVKLKEFCENFNFSAGDWLTLYTRIQDAYLELKRQEQFSKKSVFVYYRPEERRHQFSEMYLNTPG